MYVRALPVTIFHFLMAQRSFCSIIYGVSEKVVQRAGLGPYTERDERQAQNHRGRRCA